MSQDKKVKICHLTSVHRATDTRIFYKECRGLSRYFDTVLIAPAIKDQIIDDVKIVAVKPPKNRVRRFLFTDWDILFKGLKVNAALYHIHDPELIVQGLVLRALGKKVIYDVEEDVRADIQDKDWLFPKTIFKALFLFFEKLAVRYFYLILAEESYSEIFKNRMSDFIVVQNFVQVVELNITGDKLQSEKNTIIFIGTLGARRALPYIIDAFYILRQKGILINLKCIGAKDHAVEEILMASTAWPYVKGQIDFRGYIPYPECLQDIGGCFAGLALPETLPNHIGSYPTKMFEYMAAGLPVIASDFPLYKEVVEKNDCGLTVTPENSAQIADAILYLYRHPDAATRMSKNALLAVKHYDWKTEEQKLLELYNRILNS